MPFPFRSLLYRLKLILVAVPPSLAANALDRCKQVIPSLYYFHSLNSRNITNPDTDAGMCSCYGLAKMRREIKRFGQQTVRFIIAAIGSNAASRVVLPYSKKLEVRGGIGTELRL